MPDDTSKDISTVSRRHFLQGISGSFLLAGGCILGGVKPLHADSMPLANSLALHLASSVKTDSAGHQLLTLQRDQPNLQKSGWRGHQAVASPDGHFLVSVARRPDAQLLIEDIKSGQSYFVNADEGRHFYGHGLFTPDGRWFYAPENDYDAARGVIGRYDPQNNFKKVAEWDSHGIGPHQIAFLPLTEAESKAHPIMVIANGGIETHPDYPRIKLNPETMQPNISYINGNGELLEQVEPPHHQLSLRHLDVSVDGQVWVGAQYQGEVFESPNLIFSHRMGDTSLKSVEAVSTLWPQLRGYIASVSCHTGSDTVCITAPRDNSVTFWQRSTGKLIKTQKLEDCAGVCAHPELPIYYVSSGNGDLAAFDAKSGKKIWQQNFAGIHWDNHLTWIS
ncbi:DUF1513 domain-containing protein [Oceanospirillum linum]|nr:DUF1513 domain-containing protein [Oceanospirillum linum]